MNQEIDQSTMPHQFLCPIFQQIMKDPVLTVDGFCFERRAIEQWFNKGKKTNPLTNKALASTSLVQNRVLRQVIELHNLRVRQIERLANESAKKIVQQSNEIISQFFPEMIQGNGLVNLDKIFEISSQVGQLRNLLRLTNNRFSQLKKIGDKQMIPCQECKNTVDSIKMYKNFLDREVNQVLKTNPSISQRQIKKQQLPYIIINSDCIKGIDFRRLKPNDIIKYVVTGAMIKRLTVEQIVAKIRAERKIPPKDFVRIWVTDMTIQDLHKHIIQQVESITGTYVCKVRCVGTKIQNFKTKINQLQIATSDKHYWIVEHGPNEDYVFRNDETKCDYCYKIKKVACQCQCKKVFYCSPDCMTKDKTYHERVCKLIVGSQGYLKI